MARTTEIEVVDLREAVQQEVVGRRDFSDQAGTQKQELKGDAPRGQRPRWIVLFAAEARPEQQGCQPHEPFPELGRQFWDCLYYHRGGTSPPIPSNKSWISGWRHLPTARWPSSSAVELFGDERLFRCGRRSRRTWIPLPGVPASGESVVPLGLLPGHCVADLGRGPVVVFNPAFQAGRKGSCGALRTQRSDR
jgi:hypothetical protein